MARSTTCGAVGYPWADFAGLASKISGQKLDSFFQVWLESRHRPAPIPRNGFPRRAIAALAHGSVQPPASFAAISRTDQDLHSGR